MIRPVLMATLAIVGQAQYLYAPYGLASVPASQEDDFNRNTHSRQYWSPFGNSYQPQVVRPNQYFSRPSSSSSSSSYPSNYGSSGRFSSPSSSSSQTGFNTFPSSSGSSSGGNNGYSTYYREAPPKPRAPTSVNQQFQSRPQIIEQPHRVFTTKAAAAPTTPTTTTETPTTTTTTPTTTSTTPTTITTTTTTTTTTRSTTTTTRSTTTSAATITPTPLITTSETPKPVGDFRTDPTYQDEYKMFMEWLKNKKNHANIQLQRSPDEGDEKIQDTAASEAPQVTTSPILDTTIRTTSERPVVELAKTLTTQVPELPEYDALEDGEQNPDTRTDEALESTSTTTDPIATTTEVAELEETTTDVIPTIPETTTTVDEMADTTTVKDALADTTTSVPLNNQEEAREIVKIKGFLYRKVPIKVTELMKSRTKPLEEQMGIDSTDIAEEPTTAVVTEGFPETTTANDDDSTTEVPITTETATDKINEGLEEDLEVSDEVSSKTTASPRVVKKINSFPRQRPGFFRRPFPLKKNRLHFLTLSAPTQVPNIFSHSMPAQTVTHRSPGVFMFNGNHRNVMRNRQKLRPFATTEPPASTTTTTTASPIEAQTTRRGWIPSRWRPAYRYTTSRKTTKIPILLNTDRSSMESSFKPMMRVMSPTRSPQKPRTVEEIDETEEKLAEERRKRILKPKRPVFIQQISPTIATEKDQPSTNRHRTTLLLKSVQPRRTLVTTTEAVEVPDTTTEMETDTGETTASPTTSAPQEELTATTRVPNSPDFIPFLGEAIPIASEDIVMEEDGLIIHVEEFEAQVNPDSIIIESAEVTVEESDESTPDVKTFRPYPYVHRPPFEHKSKSRRPTTASASEPGSVTPGPRTVTTRRQFGSTASIVKVERPVTTTIRSKPSSTTMAPTTTTQKPTSSTRRSRTSRRPSAPSTSTTKRPPTMTTTIFTSTSKSTPSTTASTSTTKRPSPTTTKTISITTSKSTPSTTASTSTSKRPPKTTTTQPSTIPPPTMFDVPAQVQELDRGASTLKTKAPSPKGTNMFNSVNFFDRYYKSGWAEKDVKDLTRFRPASSYPNPVMASVHSFGSRDSSARAVPVGSNDNIPDFLKFAVPMKTQAINRKMDVVFDGYARYVRN